MKYIRQILFLFALFFVFTISMAYAQEREDSTSYGLNSLWELVGGDIKIGDHVYDREELIRDFVHVAFSDYQWGEEQKIYKKEALIENKAKVKSLSKTSPIANIFYRYSDSKFLVDQSHLKVFDSSKERNLAWMREYVLRDKGVPRIDVINKWEKPVHVTIGFPSVMEPWNFQHYFPPDDNKTAIEEHVEQIVSVLSSEANIDISYVQNVDGKTVKPANLIISFVDKISNPESTFKRDLFLGFGLGSYWGGYQSTYEELLTGAVRFTPYQRAQVEGYFIPNAQNEIEMAICYIWNKHPMELQKALIDECVIRSLGLPNLSKLTAPGVLAHGGFVDDKYARLSTLDGIPSPTVGSIIIGGSPGIAKISTGAGMNIADSKDYKSVPIIRKEIQKKPLPDGYSEYDLFMLRLLYSDQIKPGQSYRSVGVLLEDLFLNPKEKSSKSKGKEL